MITEIKADTSHYDRCRTMMLQHKQHHLKRAVLVSILMLINAYVSIIRAPIIHGLLALHGFFFGISIFLYCVVIVITGFLAIPEKPKLLVITCILITIGIIGEWITLYLGIPMLILFLWQIPEAKQAVWIKKQKGYPHFNQRFDEQMSHFGKEYQPMHQFDNLRDAEMPDMPETASPDFILPSEIPPAPEMIQDIPELQLSDSPVTENAPEITQDTLKTIISDMTATEQIQFFPENRQENGLGTDRILARPVQHSGNDSEIRKERT